MTVLRYITIHVACTPPYHVVKQALALVSRPVLGQKKEGEEEPRRPAREWAPGTGYGYLTHGTGQENATLASFAFSQVRQYYHNS